MLNLSKRSLLRLCLLPAVLLLTAFFFYPLVRIVGMSMHLPGFSLKEFDVAFNAVNLGITLKTFVIAGSVTMLCLLIGYPMAAFLTCVQPATRKLLLLCVVIPFLTSFLVRSYAWIVLLGDQGAINAALLRLGVIDEPLVLLYSRFGMMIGMVHVMLPMMVLPIFAAMHRIDPALWRAASSLGGGGVRTFLTVYLPQTAAGVRSGCVLVFIISLGFYITPAMLGHSRDVMLGNLIANNVENSLNFPFAAALALVLLVVTLIVYVALGGGKTGASPAAGDQVRPAASRWRVLAAVVPMRWRNRSPTVAWSGASWVRHSGVTRPSGGRWAQWALFGFGAMVCFYLMVPSIIVVIASFNGEDNLAFPPNRWSLRWYEFLLSDAQWAAAGLASLKIGIVSTLAAVTAGTFSAYGIARLGRSPEGRFAYAMVLAPMVIPAVVTALGAFAVLADWGLYGTLTGVVVMHTCLSIPLVVVVMVAAFAAFDPRLEMAAQSLGASRRYTFRRVMLPLLAPALLSALLFAFLHSFDELIMTSFIAGTQVVTVPTKMWENVRNQVDPAIAALSTLLILLPLLVLVFRRNPRGVTEQEGGGALSAAT
ncbi:ABC transporter permease subunit [Variovorax sp. KK3]|uniref:ABC transporter permease subunit n=1 Tax=Variovorax sp. KK3 TaxID=1855728 RepID=UPI00097C5F13|nr:ABC transporter permease subunit [Variovorax sp. KK3]